MAGGAYLCISGGFSYIPLGLAEDGGWREMYRQAHPTKFQLRIQEERKDNIDSGSDGVDHWHIISLFFNGQRRKRRTGKEGHDEQKRSMSEEAPNCAHSARGCNPSEDLGVALVFDAISRYEGHFNIGVAAELGCSEPDEFLVGLYDSVTPS